MTESEGFADACENIPGIEAVSASELNAYMLAPGAHPGRATLFTVNSVKRYSGEEVKRIPRKITKVEMRLKARDYEPEPEKPPAKKEAPKLEKKAAAKPAKKPAAKTPVKKPVKTAPAKKAVKEAKE